MFNTMGVKGRQRLRCTGCTGFDHDEDHHSEIESVDTMLFGFLSSGDFVNNRTGKLHFLIISCNM